MYDKRLPEMRRNALAERQTSAARAVADAVRYGKYAAAAPAG
jgi:hypothetical protein